MAAHAGREVVQAKQVGQFVAVLGAALHRVQQGELAVQEDLVAAGEVDEDLGDAASHVRLLDGGLDGGALEGVERLADLADLVAVVGEVRGLGLDVDLLTGGQSAHDARQPDAGDLVGVLAEPGEVADQLTADAYGDEDRDDQGQEAEDSGDPGLGEDPVAGRFRTVLEAVAHLRGVGREPVEDGRGDFLPACGVDGARALGGSGGDQGVLGGAQRFGVRAAPELFDAAAFGGGEVLQTDVVQQLALGHQAGYLAEFSGGEAARDEAGGDEGVLPRQHLAGPGYPDQRPHLLVQRTVLRGVETIEETVRRVDEAVVEVQRLRPADGALLDRFAQRAQSVDCGQDRVETGAGLGFQRLADVALPGALPDLGHDPVGVGVPAQQEGQGVGGAGIGQEDEGLTALGLDGADRLLQRSGDLLDGVADVDQLGRLAAGDVSGQDPEAREGNERHQQQRHDLPADGLPAKAHGLPRSAPLRGGGLLPVVPRPCLDVRPVYTGAHRTDAGEGTSYVNKRREPTTDTETTRRHVRMIFSRPNGIW